LSTGFRHDFIEHFCRHTNTINTLVAKINYLPNLHKL
jgi:hypothetical protein